MQFHDFDRPVINLHELTNGLEKYFSTDFNREIVSKRQVTDWGYYQTLDQIVQMLSSVDHYKTSRLAQYHIRCRQDPLDQQIPFYQYLDQNFFVIACRRNNVFEHALSMSINAITKRLNVYSPQEKINVFIGMYTDQIEIDQQVFLQQLDAYEQYLQWSSNHFNIGSYFYYDQHLDNIEQYILNLPIFCNQPHRITWHDKFQLHFNDWNRLHHISSDLGRLSTGVLRSIAQHHTERMGATSDYQQASSTKSLGSYTDEDLALLPIEMQIHERTDEISSTDGKIALAVTKSWDHSTRQFVLNNMCTYDTVCAAIDRMQDLDIIMSRPPIKKQTLDEKMRMIKNFNQCMDTYNEWISRHPQVAKPISDEDVMDQSAKEQRFWRSFSTEAGAKSAVPAIGRSEYQNDDDL